MAAQIAQIAGVPGQLAVGAVAAAIRPAPSGRQPAEPRPLQAGHHPHAAEESSRLRPAPAALAIAATLLLAWGLRLYRLDAQSLWYDEGVSAALALRSFAAITRDAALDIHPPLYYYLLHAWSTLVGTSEFTLRVPSVLFGLVVTCLTYKLGQRLFGLQVGLVAALFAAASPILVYYSQEARMHLQMTALAGLSMYLFLKLIVDGERRRGKLLWTGYVVATTAMLYSHYFAFTVVLLQNTYFAGRWLVCMGSGWRSRQAAPGRPDEPASIAGVTMGRGCEATTPLLHWLGLQLLLSLLFLPWLAIVYGQLLGYPGQQSGIVGLGALLHDPFRAFAFGVGWDASYTARRELALALLFLAAPLHAFVPPSTRSYRHAALLLLYGGIPVLIMYLLSLQRPMYQPRYLLLSAPAFYIVGATGVIGIQQTLGRLIRSMPIPCLRTADRLVAAVVLVGALAVFLYPAAAALRAYYFDPKYARDDYRGMASHVADNRAEGDAIVLNAPGQIEIFDYYYRGSLPRYPLPRQRPIDEAATAADLEAITLQHRRIWLVLWAVDESDPRGFVQGWLNLHAEKEVDRPFGTVRLLRYALPSGESPTTSRGDGRGPQGSRGGVSCGAG